MKRMMLVLAFIVAASTLALGQGGNTEQSIKALMEQLRQASLKGTPLPSINCWRTITS